MSGAIGWERLMRCRAHVLDAEVLRALTPPLVAAYLERTGWTRVPTPVTNWARYERTGWDVEVPANGDFSDYARCMVTVLGDLETAEDRSQLAIVADVLGLAWPPVATVAQIADVQAAAEERGTRDAVTDALDDLAAEIRAAMTDPDEARRQAVREWAKTKGDP